MSLLPSNDPALIAQIKRHEGTGKRLPNGNFLPYEDTVGVLTVGYGHNLETGIPEPIAELLLSCDIEAHSVELPYIFPTFATYSPNRQRALIDMAFNLGLARFKGFKGMIKFVLGEQWDKAADEALDSKWAAQVGPRALELAEMLRRG